MSWLLISPALDWTSNGNLDAGVIVSEDEGSEDKGDRYSSWAWGIRNRYKYCEVFAWVDQD